MYHIGELAKMVEIAPDMIRYYEEQRMVEHEIRAKGGLRLYTENGLQRLKFIRHVRQLGFSLELIHELLSIRIGPEHHTCQGSKDIVQERLWEVEVCTAELQGMQHSSQRLNNTRYRTTHSNVYCSTLKALEQGVSDVRSGC